MAQMLILIKGNKTAMELAIAKQTAEVKTIAERASGATIVANFDTDKNAQDVLALVISHPSYKNSQEPAQYVILPQNVEPVLITAFGTALNQVVEIDLDDKIIVTVKNGALVSVEQDLDGTAQKVNIAVAVAKEELRSENATLANNLRAELKTAELSYNEILELLKAENPDVKALLEA